MTIEYKYVGVGKQKNILKRKLNLAFICFHLCLCILPYHDFSFYAASEFYKNISYFCQHQTSECWLNLFYLL